MIGKFLTAIPFKTGLIVGLLCYLIVEKSPTGSLHVAWPEADDLQKYRTEFYPLSAFPMYAEFSDAPIITYFTNAQDEPVRIDSMTTSGATASKKDYYGRLKEIWQKKKATGKGVKISNADLAIKQEAGRAALEEFLTTRAATWSTQHPDEVLRLYEGVLQLPAQGGKIELKKTLVAEGSRNSLSAKP